MLLTARAVEADVHDRTVRVKRRGEPRICWPACPTQSEHSVRTKESEGRSSRNGRPETLVILLLLLVDYWALP